MTVNDSDSQEKSLTLKMQQAAASLARGSTLETAAKDAGVAEITISRWKRLPHFMTALHEFEDTLYNEQMRILKKTAGAAIACLVRNMNCKANYVQVAAASKLLDLGIQVHKVAELEAEIAELRQLVGRDDDDDLAS